jgi:hypothetical protein
VSLRARSCWCWLLAPCCRGWPPGRFHQTVTATNRRRRPSPRPERVADDDRGATDAHRVAAHVTRSRSRRGPYGDGWARVDGCSVRQKVLADEMVSGEVDGCWIEHGRWRDWYQPGSPLTGVDRVEVEHVVPLARRGRPTRIAGRLTAVGVRQRSVVISELDRCVRRGQRGEGSEPTGRVGATESAVALPVRDQVDRDQAPLGSVYHRCRASGARRIA